MIFWEKISDGLVSHIEILIYFTKLKNDYKNKGVNGIPCY